jgi:hypothetical protein
MSRLTIRIPSRDYLALDAPALERELQAFIRARRPDQVNSFFAGDTARILIEFLSYIGESLSYNIGRVGEEAFLATARERDSALRHASTLAYPVRTVTPATAVLVPENYADVNERITSRVNRNEIQKLTFAVTGGAPSGSIVLTYDAENSAPIPYPPTLSAVREALGSISQIGTDNVDVTSPSTGVYDIEFVGALQYADVSTLGVVPTLTDATASIAVVQDGLNAALTVVFNAGDVYSSGGLSWEVVDTVTVVGSEVDETNYREKFAVTVAEGTSFSESFVSNCRAFQIWTSDATRVVAGNVEVRVGDAGATPWTRVDTIALASASDEAYEARYDNQGRLLLRFGNGVNGRVPPEGMLVIVNGRSANGVRGNVGIRGVRVSVRGSADDGGTPVQFSVPLVNIAPANGGLDDESLDELRRNIPRWVRTVDKAITKEDYDTQAELFNGPEGAVARAASYLASATILSQTGGDPITPASPMTVTQGTVFSLGGRTFTTSRELTVSETDPILFFNPNVVYVYVWALGAAGFEGANPALLSSVRTYLQDRSVITTTIQTIAGRQRIIDVDLGEVTYDGTYSVTDIRAAIVAATRAFFVSDALRPGSAFRLSDYYNVIENVPGVDHFVIVTPTGDVAVAKDEMPVLGTLTFTLESVAVDLDTDANVGTFGSELFR